MKTPLYESSAGAGDALLATRQFGYATLYHFALLNGAGDLYYTSADWNVLYNGNTYTTPNGGNGAIIERKGSKGHVKCRIGTQPNEITFDIMPNGATINGQDFLAAVKNRVFAGADLTFMEMIWASGGFSNPIVPTAVYGMFGGRISTAQTARSVATFTAKDYVNLLNINLPKNIYQSGCINTLYDSGCTLNRNSFKEAGSAASGSTAAIINASLSGATGIYDHGSIVFTSGANNGLSRTVKTYIHGSPGTVSLISPFPFAPAISDTFNIFQGCDRQQATCSGKFANLSNFRGFPYIPENQTGV